VGGADDVTLLFQREAPIEEKLMSLVKSEEGAWKGSDAILWYVANLLPPGSSSITYAFHQSSDFGKRVAVVASSKSLGTIGTFTVPLEEVVDSLEESQNEQSEEGRSYRQMG